MTEKIKEIKRLKTALAYVRVSNRMTSSLKQPSARLAHSIGTFLYALDYRILGQSLQATGLGIEITRAW